MRHRGLLCLEQCRRFGGVRDLENAFDAGGVGQQEVLIALAREGERDGGDTIQLARDSRGGGDVEGWGVLDHRRRISALSGLLTSRKPHLVSSCATPPGRSAAWKESATNRTCPPRLKALIPRRPNRSFRSSTKSCGASRTGSWPRASRSHALHDGARPRGVRQARRPDARPVREPSALSRRRRAGDASHSRRVRAQGPRGEARRKLASPRPRPGGHSGRGARRSARRARRRARAAVTGSTRDSARSSSAASSAA